VIPVLVRTAHTRLRLGRARRGTLVAGLDPPPLFVAFVSFVLFVIARRQSRSRIRSTFTCWRTSRGAVSIFCRSVGWIFTLSPCTAAAAE